MPQRVAGLYRLTTASRPVGEPPEERFWGLKGFEGFEGFEGTEKMQIATVKEY
ncbi:hypothetical protein EH11_04214 [Bacillus subtilis]|nr:hypothetical protein EH11_04214 [Bacillus subtilis]